MKEVMEIDVHVYRDSSDEHKNTVIMSHWVYHEDFKTFRFHFQGFRTFEHHFSLKHKLWIQFY